MHAGPACLDQVHIVMQIAYGLTNAMEIVVRLRPRYIVRCVGVPCTAVYART